ncbi:MAG: glycosyltransferase family 10 [Candidatus Lokiarchaeota archaeon]|nr:glycosyltransferase family 10 [Candidatus Lokiarchaeota archaeon]
MKPNIFYHSWNPFENVNLNFQDLVSISIDTYNMNKNAKYKILILYLAEPTASLFHIKIDYEIISKFDKVYTHNSDILLNCDNAEFLPFGSCWIDFEELCLNKQNHITFVTSSKTFTNGHLLRHHIFEYFNTLDYINEFEIYQHKSPPYHNRRNDFFETSKFNIVVENCRENNYFSEKLIDCFASKTIPIYWGCPNISNFFDSNGIIIFESFEELKFKLQNITPEDYKRMEEFIEKNSELSKKYYGNNCITKRLPKKITDYIETVDNLK